MEIWLQVDQIDRRDALYRAAAADELEQGQPAGIRLLFQCEPRCGPSPLEPGQRTPHRRIRQAADADVQRLWIGGRAALSPGGRRGGDTGSRTCTPRGTPFTS